MGTPLTPREALQQLLRTAPLPTAGAPAPLALDTRGKDRGLAVLLTVVLGPIGLCYLEPGRGLALTLTSLFLCWTVIVPVGIWIYSISRVFQLMPRTRPSAGIAGLD